MTNKSELLDQLKAKREELKTLKKDLKERQKAIEKRTKSPNSELADALEEVEGLIEEANRIQSQNGAWSDFVKAVKKFFGILTKDGMAGVAAQATVSAIGYFVDKYLNKGIRRELVNVAFKPPKQTWGRLSLETSFALSLKVGLAGDATIDIVVVKGAMGGFATASVVLQLDASFTIPIVDKPVSCVVTGGVDGNLSATAGVAISLRPDGPNLKGELSQTIVETELDTNFYLIIPQSVVKTWNAIAKYSFGKLDEIDDRLDYKSGKMKLFNITVPGFNAGFNIKSCEFSGSPTGGFSFNPGPDAKALLGKLEGLLPWGK